MDLLDSTATLDQRIAYFDDALARLHEARVLDAYAPKTEVLEAAGAVLAAEGGPNALYWRSIAIEAAGVYVGTDWARPNILQARLAKYSLRAGAPEMTAIEALSELRLLAVAKGDYVHPGISAERARRFITQVMALNLDLLSDTLNEADRERPRQMGLAVQRLYRFQLEHMGYESILDSLVDEVWRILAQRPIQVDSARQMVIQIATCLYEPAITTNPDIHNERAADLVASLFGPAPGCGDDPGLEVYGQRLAAMNGEALTTEAIAFAQAMHNTGLVSVYHAVFVRHLRGLKDDLGGDFGNKLIPTALGLSSTGHETLMCYQQLVHALIDEAVFAETSQALYGLARLLERGVLFSPPVAAAIWRQIRLELSPETAEVLSTALGTDQPPRVFLLAGVIGLLGQPLGIGQGNNPTCQSVIGLSMWAANDPTYLLQLIAWAARDNEVLARFEGERVSSAGLAAGLAKQAPLDVDAVSLVLVPHLDRIYIEMGRLCGERDEDLHRWINPGFYGWWVGIGFCAVANAQTGRIDDHERFIRRFYAGYHPYYNGNIPRIHPQPAGIAATDSAARYVGRHAISIRRVALDPDNEMRVYFFNPNSDSGQDWGQGIVTATEGHGEFYGEASLPIHQFAARLYVFHYDPLEPGEPDAVPAEEVARAIELARASWARNM
ncbi:hypothetical protein [Salinisphaera aquimarina]|uniref:Uncharacterized protein n=1 Tax=Salinisphaera aquimarina TaxID=2094031 RepID=A0ABV7EKA3_9GAMM